MDSRLLGRLEGETELFQEGEGFEVGFRCRNDGYIHPTNLIDLVVVDVGKHQLFFNPKTIISMTIKTFHADPLKVTNSWKS